MADRSPFVDEPAGAAEPDWGPSSPTSVVVSPPVEGTTRPGPVEPEDGFPVSKVVS